MPASPPPGQSSASDAELLVAVARCDRAAFAALFDRYAGKLKGFIMRSGASDADADEIVQDVMVAIWRRAGTFDPARAAASTWIFAIARNRRIDLIRRSRRPMPDPADPMWRPDPEPDGADRLSQAEREAQVRAGLDVLAPEQRAVLVAAFYDGLSHGEIAAAQGLPLGTVKSRLRLAFRRLRLELGDDITEETEDA
jgi:RNA polymerase sigma-70 factor (ECF subfamily)